MSNSLRVEVGGRKGGAAPVAALVLGVAIGWLTPGAFGQEQGVTLETANEVVGVGVLEPGKWGGLRSTVTNSTEGEETVLVAATFPVDPLRQFCTRVWVPARSARTVLTPVLPPRAADSRRALEASSRLLVGAAERPGAAASSNVITTEGRFDSAIVGDNEDQRGASLVSALRQAAGLKPTTSLVRPGNLPSTPEGYEAIDSLFVGAAGLDLNPLQQDALRRFVQRGGKLWIMLEGREPEWPAAVFGDDWTLGVVDRVEVTKFTMEGPGGATEQSLDHGVDLVQVVAPGFEVTHSIAGSPAALRKSIGRGQVVVTTLGAPGWLGADGGATPGLADLQGFVAPPERAGVPEPADVFDGHILRSIGYRVLDRGTVIGVLSAGVLGLILAGLWGARRQRLELAAPIGLVCALVAGGVLVGLGRARQTQAASVAGTAQLIRCEAGTARVEAIERASVYLSPTDATDAKPVRSTRGGAMVPDRTDSGAMVRLVWSDPDNCKVEGMDLRPGAAAKLTTRLTGTLPCVPRATIALGGDGVVGQLSIDGIALREAPLLATPSGMMAVHIDGTGVMRAGEGDQLPPGVFGSESVLTEEQISRHQVLRRLVGDTGLLARPTLLCWSDPVDFGLRLPARVSGDSLLAIPVEIVAPPAGSSVWIPSTLMTPAPLRRSFAGRPSSTIYDSATRAWLSDIQQPMLVMMQFRPPGEIGPVDVRAARLTLDVRAPGRVYDVVIPVGETLRVVGGGANPVGRVVFDLAGEDAPTLRPDGTVLIGIDMKAGQAQAGGQGWSIQRMELSISGRTP